MPKYFEVLIPISNIENNKAYRWVTEELGPQSSSRNYAMGVYSGTTRWIYLLGDPNRNHIYRFRDEEDAIQFKLLWG